MSKDITAQPSWVERLEAETPPAETTEKQPEAEPDKQPPLDPGGGNATDDAEPDDSDLDDLTEGQAILEELRAMREDAAAARNKPITKEQPDDPLAGIDPTMRALLESDDEATRLLAERLYKAEQRNAALEQAVTNQAIQRELDVLVNEVNAAVKELGLTEKQVNAVRYYMQSDPEIATTKTFAEAAKDLFGDPKATPTPKPTPRSQPATPRADGKSATVIDGGGTAKPATTEGRDAKQAPRAPVRVKSFEDAFNRPEVLERFRQ